jgi:hypothetical protein
MLECCLQSRGLRCGFAVAAALLLVLSLRSQETPPAADAPAQEFFIHEFHATQLTLDCNTCHVPEQEGSVVYRRPGHDECTSCHQPAFETDLNPLICKQCHTTFPPTSNEDLQPFPLFRKQRAILFDFSHAKHVDPTARIDSKTGFRSDCTFCHNFDDKGIFAEFPRHTECSACHSKSNVTPNLSATSTTDDCRGCHTPEEIENPGFTKERRMIADHVITGVHVNLKFSHVAHFAVKEKYNLDCTSCHYSVPESTGLADLSLPQMVDCVACHDAKDIPEENQMSNCTSCHIDEQQGTVPTSHTRNQKPAFHTEAFRLRHENEATAPGAKCFVCHQNVSAVTSVASYQAAENQCIACHQVMRPNNHTARWKDDIHGKHAALDRTTCATCHTADSCVRCHNVTPRSHQPLATFVGGGHALPAMLDIRSCLTCHTQTNTCSECHVQTLR